MQRSEGANQRTNIEWEIIEVCEIELSSSQDKRKAQASRHYER